MRYSNTMAVMSTTVMTVLMLVITSCAGGTAGDISTPAAPMAQPCARTHRIIVALDRTASYGVRSAGQQQVASLLERSLCPGDELLVRWIAEESGSLTEASFSTRLRTIPPKPELRNPLARTTYRRDLRVWNQYFTAFARERSDLATRIRTMEAPDAPATDLWGAFKKAESLLANTPAGAMPVIIMATDLADTAGRVTPLALTDVAVVVLAFQGEDAIASAARHDQWRAVLTQAGAQPVMVFDASEPVVGTLDQLISRDTSR